MVIQSIFFQLPWPVVLDTIFSIPGIVLRELPVGKAQTIIMYRVIVKLSSKLSLLYILPS